MPGWKTGTALAFVASLGAMEVGQRRVNYQNAQMNHAFTISSLPLEEKLRYALGTSLYKNSATQALASRVPQMRNMLRHSPRGGLVHLYASELQSVEDARANIEALRKEAGKPILISADIEGGLIRHFSFTESDLRRFGIPERILVERRNEYAFYLARHNGDTSKVRSVAAFPLPSQEWLGRVYSRLTTDSARQRFLLDVQGYGRAIAKLCEHVGINIVFGPNLDIVENIDGTKPDELNDRSFGTRPELVSALARSYIRGFKESSSVVIVPKHFIGTSLSPNDPHSTPSGADIGRQSGALIPYRDVLNDHNHPEIVARQIQTLESQIEAVEMKNAEYNARLASLSQNEQRRIRSTIEANTRNIALWKARIQELRTAPESKGTIGGMMTAVTRANIWGDAETPGAYSRRTLRALTGPKSNTALGLQGPAFTDDLSMESARAYIRTLMQQRKEGAPRNEDALAIHQALAAGNSIAFIRGIAGREAEILKEVASYIQRGLDMNHDGRPDLTESEINMLVKKILDLHVRVGLLSKQMIRGEEYYVMPPTLYNPTTLEVLMNSFFSNQWPFLSKDTPAPSRQPASYSLALKAAKNFILSLWRVNIPHLDPKYAGAEQNPQRMIVIDKSARHAWIYDAQTRTLIQSFDIAIGKGGTGERRFVGDHTTPTGTYQVVGRRDARWWLANKGEVMPAEYGGIEGGMLVLAGQWHPEIAIHGTQPGGETGEVSNGCVRVDNKRVTELLHQVPTGTMVIITK